MELVSLKFVLCGPVPSKIIFESHTSVVVRRHNIYNESVIFAHHSFTSLDTILYLFPFILIVLLISFQVTQSRLGGWRKVCQNGLYCRFMLEAFNAEYFLLVYF